MVLNFINSFNGRKTFPATDMDCVVCKIATRKYKCPKCLKPYCSLACYKVHRNSDDCQPPCAVDDEVSHVLEEPTLHYPFPTEDTVSKSQLEKLADSKHLKSLLANRHLKKLLHDLDVTPNPAKAIEAAMYEPLFIEFADECLKIIEPDPEGCS